MPAEEIKDTIVVAGSPEPEVDEDKAVASEAIQDCITVATTGTSSAAPRPPRQPERAPVRVCGFCRPFHTGNGPCSHVGQPRQSVQTTKRRIVVAKGTTRRRSK